MNEKIINKRNIQQDIRIREFLSTRLVTDRGCLIHHNDEGTYGNIYYRGKIHPIHRVVYMLTYGWIPKGSNVCHKCNVKECSNIEHLYLGTTLKGVKSGYKQKRERKERKALVFIKKENEEEVIALKELDKQMLDFFNTLNDDLST